MATDKNGRTLPKGFKCRADGTIEGRFQYKGTRYSVYANSISECKTKLNDLKHDLEHGVFCMPEKMKVNKWFETWIETYKKPTVKISTIDSYEKHYNAYLRDSIGKYQLADIRTEHLQAVLNKMAKDGYSDSTITLVCMVMSGLFGMAYKLEYIPKNPYIYIIKPKGTTSGERICFTEEQTKIFLEYSKGSYLDNLFQLALYTGMRGGELRSLTWQDVDFKNRVIHVRHTLVDMKGGGWYCDTPKNATSIRDIPIMDIAYRILKNQKAYYDTFQVEKIQPIKNTDFVFFADTENTPISRKRVTYEINRMLEEMHDNGIDFPYFTLHATRHTFATRCAENGMNLQVLQKILGHATLSMTTDLYGGHVIEERKQKEIEKVSDAFRVAI